LPSTDSRNNGKHGNKESKGNSTKEGEVIAVALLCKYKK
jgi:hypothetical protein